MTQLPILFLPGTLCTGAMFSQQIQHLQQFCNDISVVQFTTEHSLSEMANKVITATKGNPCAIVGFSMGGIVAAEVAKTHPQLIAKLALVNSNCHADLPERKAARGAQIQQAKSGKLVDLITDTFLPNYLFEHTKPHEQLILDMATTLGADCFAAQVRAIEDRPDALSVLKSLTSDIVIIGGRQDKICPAEHQQMMHDNLPKSHLALLDECCHFSPLEQAEHVSNLLTQWYLSDSL
ncbi:alpha/beta hydrolase [Colwellia sp. MSW7]|uniref:Alpha/beta hydrolase n=1 Tax=Colwellia maritima TaxID=2912588 RepID=A0ABS9X5D1_9GAMM|nr:alpha/beta hydrolase [Colwellia maritima]MCI2285426.1 alpha/beta hydrolase [Colwellia maritima]